MYYILFQDCVMTCLKGKTVILVTHQVEFLSSVDKILVMQDGQVTQTGNYEDLLTEGTAFEKLVNAHKDSITNLDTSSSESKSKSKLHNTDNKNWQSEKNSKENILTEGLGVQLTEEEEKETGNVGWKTFLDYVIISEGSWFLTLSVMSHVGFVALQAAASYWLAFGIQIPKITKVMLICVYTLVSTTSMLFVSLRSLFATLLGLKASKAFFHKFTDSVFSAPMVFFDSTPVGRILTRVRVHYLPVLLIWKYVKGEGNVICVSSDLSVIDFDIPFSFAFAFSAGIDLLATIGIIASVTWQVLIVAIFAIAASKYVQGYYQPTARELMRINGTTKAPLVNYASETSLGVATIRAFKMQDRFFEDFLKLVDSDASTLIFSNATLEWLILRTEAFSNLTLITAAFLLVYTRKGSVSSGLVGLSLSYALALSSIQVFFTRWYCSLANYIVSIERIKQFMHIPPEQPVTLENNRPPSSWPSKGKINFEDLKVIKSYLFFSFSCEESINNMDLKVIKSYFFQQSNYCVNMANKYFCHQLES
ncbi:putative ABC-type xenobiotic transporter [Helianthus anomalus]